MTCLVEIGSSAAHWTDSYPLTVAVLAGTSKTGTPTWPPPGLTAGGSTSALSAANAQPSTSPDPMDGSTSNASFAVRTCPACNETKPLDSDHFYPGAQYRGGFRPQCIPCVRYVQQLRRLSEGDRRHTGSAVKPPEFPSLPARPLAMAMDRLIAIGHWFKPQDRDRLRKWRNGATVSVKFDEADEILQDLDLLWLDVWQPCPGDRAHYRAVAERGMCEACETYCMVEDAFTAADGPGDVHDLSDLEAGA